ADGRTDRAVRREERAPQSILRGGRRARRNPGKYEQRAGLPGLKETIMEITTNTNTPITSYFEEARDGLAGDTASQVAAMMLEHTRLSRAINQEQNQSEEAWLRQ